MLVNSLPWFGLELQAQPSVALILTVESLGNHRVGKGEEGGACPPRFAKRKIHLHVTKQDDVISHHVCLDL